MKHMKMNLIVKLAGMLDNKKETNGLVSYISYVRGINIDNINYNNNSFIDLHFIDKMI